MFTRLFQLSLIALLLTSFSTHAYSQPRKFYIKIGKSGGVGIMNDKDFPSTDDRLTGINKAMEKILDNFNVPGATVAVVERNKVIYAKGFGYKDLQNKMPVTENTLFPIGSCTKAFTATLMGTLLDEKKVDFDQPVHTWLPELEFSKPELTQQVTLRDMMTHRTGLPRHDLVWYLNNQHTNRAGLLHDIRYMGVNAELRQTWQYNNFMYMAQGVLLEKLTGKTWEDVLAERILTPLGMKQTVFRTPDLIKSPDHSIGYLYDSKDQTIRETDYYVFNGMEPAGSISSSATDMAQWLMLWLHGGQVAGKTIFSNQYHQQAIRPQMAMPDAAYRPEFNAFTYGYGLGWMIKGYKGHYLVEHGGNIDGFSATTGFFPYDSIGIFVCVNQNNSLAQVAIRNWLADRMLGVDKTDWIKTLTPPSEAVKEAADAGKPDTSESSHAPADYTGTYLNEGYGEIRVFQQGNALMATIGDDTVSLRHSHYDVFSINLHPGAIVENGIEIKIRFRTAYDGSIEGMEAQLEPALAEGIWFSKQAQEVKVPASDLAQYEGRYSLSGMEIKVYVQNKILRLLVPGQPEYELAPYQPDEFKITVADGFFVRFEMKDGKTVAASLVQPDGTYRMTRL